MAEDFTAVVGRELDRVGQDLGWSVFARNTSNSTMEDARKIVDGEGVEWQVALSDSLPSFSANTPFAVLAREQSAGRGRTGRTWSSAADTGLYATFVIFPHDQSLLEGLSLIVGVAIRRALQELGIGCGLKWPNDVVVVEEHGAFKKLAGVLIERFERSGGSVVSIGVGINTKQYAALEEVGGTSIEQQGGEVSVAGLLCLVVRHLGEVLAELAAGKRAELLEQWQSSSIMNGLIVQRESDERKWFVRGIDDRGGLLVYSADGENLKDTIYSGEVLVYAARS